MSSDQFFNNLNTSLGDFFVSPNVITCHPQMLVREVIALMNQNQVGSVVITEKNKPVGIFTERDVLKKVVGSTIIDIKTTPIQHLMTPNPVTVKTSTSFFKIMGAMRLGKFRHLVIVHDNGELQGIISIKDVLSRMIDVANDLK